MPLVLFVSLFLLQSVAPAGPPRRVHTLRIQLLSTMLADSGVGEWGFAALVEADGKQFLVDTGARAGTVLENAQEPGIDLSGITDVVLTHNHADHTGGLLTIRRALKVKNPAALSRAHVAPGIFWRRPGPKGDARLAWTAAALKRARLKHFIGAHCTGIEAVTTPAGSRVEKAGA